MSIYGSDVSGGNIKVPSRACYDRQTGALYYVKFAAGEIAKNNESSEQLIDLCQKSREEFFTFLPNSAN